MARTLDVSVMVKLIDKITGPLNKLMSKFNGFMNMAKRFGGGLADLGKRFGVFAIAASAISFAGPIASAAEFDQKLRDGVVTAGHFGQEAEAQIKRLRGFYHDLALQVGITSSSLADAGNLLIASGLDEHLAQKLLPTIGRVSKAASALPEDVANVAFALTNSMGIATDKMEENLAKLIVAGKLGRFEFKDMAKYIPTLASEFDKFGLKGTKAIETMAASLQVAMFGTSDTSAAANNFKNYLSKLLAPETAKRFKDFGVNIAGVMQNAAARGLDPVEASYQKVLQLTGLSQEKMLSIFKANKGKGMNDVEATAVALEQIKKIAGAQKLGALFGDMEVLNFILPMMANIDKYNEFKKEIANAGLDVIAKDYATQWEGLSTQLAITGEIGKQALDRIGLAFAKNLPMLNEWGTKGLKWMQEMDAKYPGLIDQVLGWGAAVLAAVAALALLAPAIALVSAGFGVLLTAVKLVFMPVRGLSSLLALVMRSAGGLAARLVSGLGTSRAALAGISSSAAAAPVTGFTTFGKRAGLAVGASLRSALRMGGALSTLQLVFDAIDDLNRTPAERFEWAKKSGEAYQNFSKDLDQNTSFGRFWKSLTTAPDGGTWLDWTKKQFDFGNDVPNPAKDIAPAMDAALPKIEDSSRTIMDRIKGIVGGGVTVPITPMMPPSWSTGGTPPGAAPANDDTPAPPGKQGFAPATSGNRFAAIVPSGRTQIGGHIVVSAAPGSKVEKVESTNREVPIRVAEHGRMVGRV